MCGIAGVYNFRTGGPVDRLAVERMGLVQAHRGPDAGSTYFSGPIGLAHRRLSIIDLNERGRQPMATADGRYVIIYNGEIYNYVELRRELVAAGWPFRTETDTEVLLALFEREGPACLKRLNGMFAFAIWDTHERSLFIARDRLGIKPLYFTDTTGGIAFASEAKALFEYPTAPCELASDLVGVYMAYGYVPGSETLFRGVRKLLPGHYMTVSPAGTQQVRYWNVAFDVNTRRSASDTAAELHDLLLDAARIHMRSDVPVGVFLSGGLDSSATVALLHEAGVVGLKTFSVAYRESEYYDETPYARLMADHVGAQHHSLFVDPARYRDSIPDFVWHMDEPVAEAAAISLYFISKLLREHVIVALSGEGADELFGGYEVYRFMRWIERYHQLPSTLRDRVIAPPMAAVGNSRLQKFLRLGALPLEQRYFGVPLRGVEDYGDLYDPDLSALMSKRRPADFVASHYAESAGHDLLTRMLNTDLKSWLVDDLLIKADKMTMAHSVELRVPFLDYRVVEFAATIPSSMKIRGGEPKWILKQALSGKLPREILRRPKVGFPTPLSIMFRDDLQGYLRDLLLSARSTARGLFRASTVERLIAEHTAGRRDHHRTLWQLVVLEEWQRKFLDGPAYQRTTQDFGLVMSS